MGQRLAKQPLQRILSALINRIIESTAEFICHMKSNLLQLVVVIVLLVSPAGLVFGIEPLQEKLDDFKVIFLGTGTPVSGPKQFGASILVEVGGRSYVFDCGRGCGIRLQQVYGVSRFHRADTLFFTHLHSDHTVGTPEMYLNGWTQGRAKPFRVFGPTRTKEMMQHMRLAFAPDIDIRRIEEFALATPERMPGAEVVAHDIVEGKVLEEGGVTITAFLVDHQHVKPAYGFRVDYQGRSVVISGDTAYSENLIKYAQGADLLIHEVMSPALIRALHRRFSQQDQVNFIVGIHTTVPDVVRVFNKVKPKLAVYYHTNNSKETSQELLDETAKGYKGRVAVSHDMMQININREVVIAATP